MKAIVYEKYGPPEVLQIKDVKKPLPQNNEILVKVKDSSVSAGVLWIRKGEHPDSKFFTFMIRLMFGLKKPKIPILGYEFSGEVESVGDNVKTFKSGDKIFGTTTGLKQGAYAEYLCIPEKPNQGVVSLMPENLSFEEASAIPIGSMAALDILKKADIKKGERILIYGASGSVGTYAVQLAKYFGAEVTGVCSSKNIELIKSIGADYIIDYKKTDISNVVQKYDVIFDAVGKISKPVCKKIMNKNSRYITIKSITNEKTEYLDFLKDLIKNGEIKPVIDRIYSFEDIVDAHGYADTGHKIGNVVIKMY